MAGYSGFVKAGAQLGANSLLLLKVTRGMKEITLDDGSTLPDIIADATIEERHVDNLEITEHPVEQGASISDHAFKRPAEVTVTMAWSNSPIGSSGIVDPGVAAVVAGNKTAAQIANVVKVGQAVVDTIGSLLDGSDPGQINSIYGALRRIQASRAMFTLYTGKMVYTNMLCKTLTTETNSKTTNSLVIHMVCKQVILVKTQVVTLPAEKQAPATASATTSPVDGGTKTPATVDNPPAEVKANSTALRAL